MGGSGDWARRLQTWLEPFLVRLGHPARRRLCPLYVAGLIGPGERKSLQPIAARLAPADDDQLHHVVTVGPWDEAPLAADTKSHWSEPVCPRMRPTGRPQHRLSSTRFGMN